MHNTLAALALAFSLILSGCGGGGVAAGSGGLGAVEPPPPAITIARTTDAQGQAHVLALDMPAPALQAALGQSSHFVVVTRSTGLASDPAAPLFSVTGDLAIGDWRFGLNLVDQDDAATILVFKAGSSPVQALAGQLGAWAQAGVFNADPLATRARLVKIVETAIANAADPALAPWYGDVAKALTDPAWNGVLLLNPSLPGLPALVQGRPAPGQRLAAHHLHIAAAPPASGAAAASSVGGLIDYPRAPVLAVVSPGGTVPFLVDLRALFARSALALYQAEVTFFGAAASDGRR